MGEGGSVIALDEELPFPNIAKRYWVQVRFPHAWVTMETFRTRLFARIAVQDYIAVLSSPKSVRLIDTKRDRVV